MLPKLLTENLCSLRADVDRLAFSTIWEVDKEASIINTKYCKTIIRSRRAFTYGQAQELMESQDKGSIATAIRNLNNIAKKLKQKRIDKGALSLASTQVKITLEEETHSATDVKMYEMMETNYLIEEFMLLSNIAVAEKIY
jgi:exosome complex exonuclease DIS3/RRP44